MSASELLDRLHRAGATLEMVDGKARIRGAAIPAELLAELKANRDAVLAEQERRKVEDKDRYSRVPGDSAPLLARDIAVPPDMRKVIEGYVHRQGRTVQAWVMKRGVEYFDLGIPATDCDWRACIDLIAWQRQTGARGALEFVTGISDL